MQMMANNLTIGNTRFADNWTFSNGITVPIYEVYSSHALNQLIGYAKFKNRDYGNVYYRGQTNIYSTLLSSLHRNYKHTQSAGRVVGKIIKKIESDNRLINDLKLGSCTKTMGLPASDDLREQGSGDVPSRLLQ